MNKDHKGDEDHMTLCDEAPIVEIERYKIINVLHNWFELVYACLYCITTYCNSKEDSSILDIDSKDDSKKFNVDL